VARHAASASADATKPTLTLPVEARKATMLAVAMVARSHPGNPGIAWKIPEKILDGWIDSR